MRTLGIDIETFSDEDLSKVGVYKYTESPNFKIQLFSYSVDEAQAVLVDLESGETLPAEIEYALVDESVEKWAFNAQFERVALSRYLNLPDGEFLDPAQWRCSMVLSSAYGLPMSLKAVGEVLELDKKKLDTGTRLINLFAKPRKATKKDPRTVNSPADLPDEWELYKTYNLRDVDTETEIRTRLLEMGTPKDLWKDYALDQRINDYGIKIDKPFVKSALKLKDLHAERAKKQMQEITRLENPNSVKQLTEWLTEQGETVTSLAKGAVEDLIDTTENEKVKEVLTIRQGASKTSLKKYETMLNASGFGDKARGMTQFYGAGRTGRFAGRLVQLQNLPQNHLDPLEFYRQLVQYENIEVMEYLGNPAQELSELIRTAFIPSRDKFIVSDFSAIEARVVAWIAGEQWRQDTFAKNGDIYCASASQMFNVPVEKHGVNGHLRQKGKIAELALGYGGGVNALKAMGGEKMGLTQIEMEEIVSHWREASPAIKSLWKNVENAIMRVVKCKVKTARSNSLTFNMRHDRLFIKLPSGREICYVEPRIVENRFGGEGLAYMGKDGTSGKWTLIESFGGKFVENIIQAIARDVLIYSMHNLEQNGYKIVAHVHDEAIIDAYDSDKVDDVVNIMSQTPEWANGLILNADGYECPYYQKD